MDLRIFFGYLIAVKPFVQSPLNDKDPFNFDRGTGQRVLVFWIIFIFINFLINLEENFS